MTERYRAHPRHGLQLQMIRTVSDFLVAVRDTALAEIDRSRPVGHPGMIGDMYEGLTRELLARSVFADFDLRVVQGKVLGPDGTLSDQLDCMVVVGEGEQLPYSPHFIYPLDQVLAVIEVKKTLYKGTLGDAHQNLLSVVDRSELRAIRGNQIVPAFRAVSGTAIHSVSDVDTMSALHQQTYNSLVGDVLLPLRVALGYQGFVSEFTLREGFWRYLESKRTIDFSTPIRAFSPFALPNLVIASDSSLVKLNAMPYALRRQQDEWMLYGSIPGQSLLVLLELLWHRIASHFDVTLDVFGEDLEIEQLNPLLSARVGIAPSGQLGWIYELGHIPSRTLKVRRPRACRGSPSWSTMCGSLRCSCCASTKRCRSKKTPISMCG